MRGLVHASSEKVCERVQKWKKWRSQVEPVRSGPAAFRSFRGLAPQTHPFMRSGEVVRRDGRKTIPDVPFGSHAERRAVALADNAAAATTSSLVLRPSLTCVRPRSGHPALLLQRRVFPGRKRSYGEMHDGGSRGFRGGVGREIKLCTTHSMDHGSFVICPL